MGDKGNKSKLFVIVISVVVIALIVIGCILTWKIVQRGQEDSMPVYDIERIFVSEYAIERDLELKAL